MFSAGSLEPHFRVAIIILKYGHTTTCGGHKYSKHYGCLFKTIIVHGIFGENPKM